MICLSTDKLTVE